MAKVIQRGTLLMEIERVILQLPLAKSRYTFTLSYPLSSNVEIFTKKRFNLLEHDE